MNKDIHEQSNEEIEDNLIELELQLEKDPSNIKILLEISSCLRHLERYPEAIVVHDRILDLEPKNLDFLFMKGLVLFESSQNEEAIACFDKILEQDKNHRDALFNKALVLKNLGEKAESKKYMRMALK